MAIKPFYHKGHIHLLNLPFFLYHLFYPLKREYSHKQAIRLLRNIYKSKEYITSEFYH